MKKLFVLAPCLMGLWTGSIFSEDFISLEKLEVHTVKIWKRQMNRIRNIRFKKFLDRVKISSAYTYVSVRSFVNGEGKLGEIVLNIILRLK